MDCERKLVSKVVHTGSVESLLAQGIESDHFVDHSARTVWEFVVGHTRKHKAPPSAAATGKFIENFKHEGKKEKGLDFQIEIVPDSLSYIAEEFIKAAKRRNAIEALRDLAAQVDDDSAVADIDALFLEKSRELAQIVPSTKVERFSNMQQRIEAYRQHKDDGTGIGILMGIPAFDDLTFGVQPHEYISIAGWQGTGKSTLLQWLFFNAYLQGKTPMFISLEMEADALYRKWDVMATNFEYRALKAMELGEGDMQKWEEWGERASEAKNDIIVIDDVARCTADRVYAETVRYSPDVVGVDYVSLMEGPRSSGNSMWEKMTWLTRSLKQNARTLKIPVYAVAQTNVNSAEGGAELSNISYSRSIGQDSDLVIGLFQDAEMKEQEAMDVRLLKNRDGPTTIQRMSWKMKTMQFEEWKTTHMFDRKGGDVNDSKQLSGQAGQTADTGAETVQAGKTPGKDD